MAGKFHQPGAARHQYQTTGLLHGKVLNVSQDAISLKLEFYPQHLKREPRGPRLSNRPQNNSPPIRNSEYVRMPAQAAVTIEKMMIIAIGQERSNDET